MPSRPTVSRPRFRLVQRLGGGGVSTALLLVLLAAATGCGAGAANAEATPVSGSATSSVAPASVAPSSVAPSSAVPSPATLQPLQLTVKVLPGDDGGLLGPDGKHHDSFVPSEISARAGVPVAITLLNYDDMTHSFTMPSLGINQMIPAARGDTPGQVVLRFTPARAGRFRWYCVTPCDGDAGGWAMTPDRNGNGPDQDGFMAGYLTVA